MITGTSTARSRQDAELFRNAADLILRDGYNPSKPADSGPGYSVSTAICEVTGCDPSGQHIDACEKLHARVAGYLYLTGQALAGPPKAYFPDVIVSWEAFRPGGGWRTREAAVNVLGHASSVLSGIGNQPADGGDRDQEELRGRAIRTAAGISDAAASEGRAV